VKAKSRLLVLTVGLLLVSLGGPETLAQDLLFRHQGNPYAGAYGLRSSYVAAAPLRLSGVEYGDVDTLELSVQYTGSRAVHTNLSIQVGGRFQWFHSDVPAAAPAPENLYAASVELGTQWRFASRWTLQVGLRPGLYSDLQDIDVGDFNLPVLALAYWRWRPDLTFIMGFSYNARRDLPVIPGLGLRWEFADRWNLLLVYPVPRVTYHVNDQWDLYAGVRLIRTSFRVSKNFGDAFGRPELNDQDVSYNDWRAALGVRREVGSGMNVTLEAGWMIQREFNFDNRDLRLDGDGAPFVSLSFGGRY
jgi:hypothetical protein